MLLEIIRIQIWVAVKFSKALYPHAGFTPVLLTLYTHAVGAGAAPVQLPSQSFLMVIGIQVNYWNESKQGWGEWLTNDALFIVGAICWWWERFSGSGPPTVETFWCDWVGLIKF